MLLTKWQHLVTKEKYTVGKTGNHKHIKIAAIFPRHSWSSNRLNKAKQQKCLPAPMFLTFFRLSYENILLKTGRIRIPQINSDSYFGSGTALLD